MVDSHLLKGIRAEKDNHLVLDNRADRRSRIVGSLIVGKREAVESLLVERLVVDIHNLGVDL